ncbi:protein yippee-like 1 isoform X2 [Channa argus]|uniref:protein yippee-like 1 isoform X2 n=1 Tax=Channa argus TaxID=215402 RepID=UPI003520B637
MPPHLQLHPLPGAPGQSRRAHLKAAIFGAMKVRTVDPGGLVAQWVEHRVEMRKAAGSNPTPPDVAPPSQQGPPWCRSRAGIKCHFKAVKEEPISLIQW